MELSGSPATVAGSYEYDGEGRRVKKTVGSATTTYVYDAMGQLMQEVQAGGTTTEPAGRSYLFQDHLGSTRLRVDATGTRQGWWDYAPFGELVPGAIGGRSGVASGAYEGPRPNMMFTGKERDAESGMDYFGTRYMSATHGRWPSPDKINVTKARMINPSSTLNKYAYAANNPLKFIDPDGNDITLYYRESRGVLTKDFGHVIIGALNQKTGQVRFLDFYPKAGQWPRGEINGNMTLDRLREHGSITVQTSPEAAQKVIEQIDKLAKNPPDYNLSARLDPGQFGPSGLACTVLCQNVLADIGIDLGGTYLPWAVWQNAYYKYGEGSWLSPLTHQYRSEGSAAPYAPNRDFGSPRYGGDMYWLMFSLYQNRNSPEPKACVSVSDSATGTSSKSCD